MKKYIIAAIVISVALGACSDSEESSAVENPANPDPSSMQVETSDIRPTFETQLVNVEGTPSATGLLRIGTNDAGETVLVLGDDFAQAMGPGDTEVRLARTAENITEQSDADATSVTEAIGIVTNGASGSMTFTVPSTIDVSAFSYAVIWCPTAGVNFGVGLLEAVDATTTNASTGINTSLVDVEGTPSATGSVVITPGANGGATITLGDDFMQAMGPGDTEVRLATGDGNVSDQLNADAASVTDAIGIIPNGASGSFTFTVPASANISDYSHLIVWCPTAGVNFGVAAL